MGLKVLHYVYNGPPISTGYTIRTQSITLAQKEQGLKPYVAISLKSLIKNYFSGIYFNSILLNENINYYSAISELNGTSGFKITSKLLSADNRTTVRLREKYYSYLRKKILSDYAEFIITQTGDVDIIHAHAPANVFKEAQIINHKLRKKIIYEIRGFWNLSSESFDQNIYSGIKEEVIACKQADSCVAICNGIADTLVRAGIPAKKISVIPNGVNAAKFQFLEKNSSLQERLNLENKIVFGYVTSVRWFEGIQTIIKAWSKIIKAVPDAVFLLAGDGNYLKNIKAMVSEYGIENNFKILGQIEKQKIPDYYSLIDIFVVPRLNVPVSNITTPLKPLEAMAGGKTVIVSDVSALREMVTDGETGVYFKADDPDNLAEMCIMLANDNKLRTCLGQNAMNWVIKNRTWSKIAQQYIELYNSILHNSES